MLKGFISVGLAVAYTFGVVLLAAAAPTGPLAQVIEGAKKEGTASVKLVAGFTPKSISRLEKEIKDKYGVDLRIKFTGATKMTSDVAEAIMEQKAGATPSYDLLSLQSHVAQANQAGVLERVDWKPLLSEGTNPNVVYDIPLMRGGIVYQTSHFGLMYNREKIKSDEFPKILADLANPKWKEKAGIFGIGQNWLRWSFVLGKEKIFSALSAILKNGAIQGAYVDLLNRYLIGEIWFCTISSAYLEATQDKGMPAAWQTLDLGEIQEFSSVVRKGASHANAAKLIAVHLASREGARLLIEEARSGTLYYPGNYEHDLSLQNQRQGIPEVFIDRKTDILEFYTTKEAAQWQEELQLLLQTGGRR